MSRLELDLGKIAGTSAGALWLIDGGRLRFLLLNACTVFCTHTGPGGSYGGVCNSSLSFLLLSSHTFIMEGSGYFASDPFQFPDLLL